MQKPSQSNQSISRKHNLPSSLRGFMEGTKIGNFKYVMRRRMDEDIMGPGSPFPLSFSFSLVFPRGNLFTVNTAMMSRKDPKCHVG